MTSILTTRRTLFKALLGVGLCSTPFAKAVAAALPKVPKAAHKWVNGPWFTEFRRSSNYHVRVSYFTAQRDDGEFFFAAVPIREEDFCNADLVSLQVNNGWDFLNTFLHADCTCSVKPGATCTIHPKPPAEETEWASSTE